MDRKEQLISEAEALWKQGQRKEAIEKLEALRRRFDNDLEILRRLARMYFHYHEADVGQKVVDLCLEILRIEPEDVETRMLLATAYWVRLVEYEKAAEEYRKVIQIDPSQLEAYTGIAAIYPEVSAEEALEALKKAVALQPDNGDLCNSLATMYRYVGEYDKELELLEKAMEKGVYDEVGTRRRIQELREKLKKG